VQRQLGEAQEAGAERHVRGRHQAGCRIGRERISAVLGHQPGADIVEFLTLFLLADGSADAVHGIGQQPQEILGLPVLVGIDEHQIVELVLDGRGYDLVARVLDHRIVDRQQGTKVDWIGLALGVLVGQTRLQRLAVGEEKLGRDGAGKGGSADQNPAHPLFLKSRVGGKANHSPAHHCHAPSLASSAAFLAASSCTALTRIGIM
jgi:hypothetical protein